MRFNSTSLQFGGWDCESLEETRAKEKREKARKIRPFSRNIMITPVRPRVQVAQTVEFSETGYPLTSSVKEFEEPRFVSSMMSHYQLRKFCGHRSLRSVLTRLHSKLCPPQRQIRQESSSSWSGVVFRGGIMVHHSRNAQARELVHLSMFSAQFE